MKRKNFDKEKVISFIILFVFGVIFLTPILWVFLSAFKNDVEINRAGGFLLFPKTWTFENFLQILNPMNFKVPIYKWFSNSIFVAIIYSTVSVIIVSMSAYAYSKLKFKGRDVLFISILFLSSFPSIVNIIPLYKVMDIMNWVNTPWALIFPGLSSVFNIFLVKQFIIGIPDSLLESARLDGAGEIRVFFQIVMPLLKPILIIVAIFSFTAIWNDFLWPSIIINDIDKLTLTAGLQLARGTYETYVSKLSAISVIAIVPMILLYCFAEKWFIRGVSISAGIKE